MVGRIARKVAVGVDRLSAGLAYGGCAVLVGLSLYTTVGVLGRYLFNQPLIHLDELGGYAMVAIVFSGFAHTTRTYRHIRVELFISKASGDVRSVLDRMALGLGLLFASLLLAASWWLTRDYFLGSTLAETSLQTPLWIPCSVMVVGSALLVAQVVVELLRRRAGETPEDELHHM